MIITISGFPGSGKSTVGKILENELGFKRYYIGGMRREMARKKGLTIEQFNKLGEADFSTDKEADEFIVEIANTEDNIIIESRTAFHFVPKSVKIFLDVELKESAKRIFSEKTKGSNRNEEAASSVEQQLKMVAERIESDSKRYKKYYGFDCYDKKNYDLVIDTTQISPEQVAGKIMEFVARIK